MSARPPGHRAGVDFGTQFTRLVIVDADADADADTDRDRATDAGPGAGAGGRAGAWMVTGSAAARPRGPVAAGRDLLATLAADSEITIAGEAGPWDLRSVGGLAVAVTGDCFATDSAAQVRARLQQALAAGLGLPQDAVAVHSTAVCAAAVRADQLAVDGGPGIPGRLVLVCDIGADSVEAALVEVATAPAGTASASTAFAGAVPAGSAPASAGVGTVRLLERWIQPGYAGRGFAVDAVRRAGHAGPAGPAGRVGPRAFGDSGDDTVPIRTENDLVLTFLRGARAGREPIGAGPVGTTADPYRDAGSALVFGPGRELRAGQLAAAFEPVAQTVRAAVGGLLRRRVDLRQPEGLRQPEDGDAVARGGASWPEVIVVGGLGFLPSAVEAVRTAVAEAWPAELPGGSAVSDVSGVFGVSDVSGVLGEAEAAGGGEAQVPVWPVAEPEYAAARGAALLAAARVRGTELYPHTVSLRVHRVLAGRLTGGSLRVISAGDVPMERCELAGELITVHHDGSAGGVLVVDVQADGDPPRALRVPLGAELPTGDYHVGVRPDRSQLGALLLSPASGGPPTVLPLGRYQRRP
ncbi:hypothetical protein Ga0074812_105120 [Parafrankia irregularis]|uniref:Uncharacterized protein n=1 Tax=Parafrankia irregularis TaxID=795642 RepID=A0A0S4QJL4_9ACTN|nr:MULTISPECIES: hypothetical protein [Parafrankia]MBE3205630.1 hypothetical protein [Parafrankia sp. CH37]CUU55470.1 hypothetical protein Ga0074812_105120 [Parafrankia irregularis]